MTAIAKRLVWALAGTLVGFGTLGPVISPAIGLVGLVLATALAAMHREATYRLVPWLAIGAVVTVAVFVGADLLAPQQCTPTGCTVPVANQVRLAVAVFVEVGLAVLAERLGARGSRAAFLLGLIVAAVPIGIASAADEPNTNLVADRASMLPSQTPEEALATDLALIAEAAGWTAAEAAAYARAEAALDRVATRLAAERPDAFVGSALAPDPGGAPRLFITGPADPGLLALVQGADTPMEIVDGQPYSLAELEARKAAVHTELQSAGYREVVTTFDLTHSGLIEATVRRQPALPSDPSTILASFPAELRSEVEVTVSDGPTVIPAGAFGRDVAPSGRRHQVLHERLVGAPSRRPSRTHRRRSPVAASPASSTLARTSVA